MKYHIRKTLLQQAKSSSHAEGGIEISRKLNKNNESGYKGVCWLKQYKKWEASLKFKSKKYYLRLYDKTEDAVKARAEGEDHIYGLFPEWYAEYKWQNSIKKDERAVSAYSHLFLSAKIRV